jgi:endo-1,4-beta-xylanase
LNKTTASLNPAGTLQLTVTVLPSDAANKELAWTSDRTDVATVNQNGLVTAVAEGTATITATAQDGSGVSATCVVTVVKYNEASKTIKVTFNANGGKKLSKKSITLKSNTKIGKLPTVECKNYIFKGWYTKKSGGTKVTKSTKLKKSTTLYAHWSKVTKPKKVSSLTVKSAKSKKLSVSFKKVSGAKGYVITYSTSKKFTSSTTKKVAVTSTKKTLTKLKKGKTYYVKVRAYKTDSTGKKIYGAYSKVKKIKVK